MSWHLPGIANRFNFRIERDEAFGDDPNVVAQALGDDIEMAPSGNAFLTHLLAEADFHSSDFRGQASVDIENVGSDRTEFFFDLSVHVATGSNNPTIVSLRRNRRV